MLSFLSHLKCCGQLLMSYFAVKAASFFVSVFFFWSTSTIAKDIFQNKLNEANEARQLMNQAREEAARLRLRVHDFEKNERSKDAVIDSLNKKIADLENQVNL